MTKKDLIFKRDLTIAAVAIAALIFIVFLSSGVERDEAPALEVAVAEDQSEVILGATAINSLKIATTSSIDIGPASEPGASRVAATNTPRGKLTVCNDGSNTAYLSEDNDFVPAPSTGIRLAAGACYQSLISEGIYTGSVQAVTSSGTTTLSVQEHNVR